MLGAAWKSVEVICVCVRVFINNPCCCGVRACVCVWVRIVFLRLFIFVRARVQHPHTCVCVGVPCDKITTTTTHFGLRIETKKNWITFFNIFAERATRNTHWNNIRFNRVQYFSRIYTYIGLHTARKKNPNNISRNIIVIKKKHTSITRAAAAACTNKSLGDVSHMPLEDIIFFFYIFPVKYANFAQIFITWFYQKNKMRWRNSLHIPTLSATRVCVCVGSTSLFQLCRPVVFFSPSRNPLVYRFCWTIAQI